MPSTRKTPNYALSQYDGTDVQKRVDGNEDMLKLDTALKVLEDSKAVKGEAYGKLENGSKVIQGVPAGGHCYFGTSATGAIKIKLPYAKTDTMFSFKIKINGYPFNHKNLELNVKGYNHIGGFGKGIDVINDCQVTILKDVATLATPKVYFCTGATEDYLLIGEITDNHSFESVSISNLQVHYNNKELDWSTGWHIYTTTTLESLASTQKVAITPSLNATHLEGKITSTDGAFSANSDDLLPTQKAVETRMKTLISQLVNSSPAALDTLNELAAALGNDPNFATTINNALANMTTQINDNKAEVTTELAKKVSNTVFDYNINNLATAINTKASATDTTNALATKVNNDDVSASQTANKIAKRDSSGEIAGVINLDGTKAINIDGQDLNLLLDTGIYFGINLSNCRFPAGCFVEVICKGSSEVNVIQKIYNSEGSGYTRGCINGTWSSWKRMLVSDGNSIEANGYTKISNGLVLQWGTTAELPHGGSCTFPITFPNGCFNVVLTGTTDGNWVVTAKTPSGFTYADASVAGAHAVHYIAIGY